MTITRNIFGYLKDTLGHEIIYENQCFIDLDWVGSKEDDLGSMTRYCVFFRGNLVSWKSKEQNIVSHSSVESKYRAMT